MKNRLLKTLCLPFILSAHFGLLSLLFGYNWIKLFYQQYPVELLSSVCVLSVFYAISFRLFRVMLDRNNHYAAVVWLCLIITAGFLLVLSAAFSGEKELYQIIASTVLFIGIIALIAFCDCRSTALWKNLQRTSAIILFLISLAFVYTYNGLVLYIFFDWPIFEKKNVLGYSSVFHKQEKLVSTEFYRLNLTRYYMPNNRYGMKPIVDYYIPAKVANIPSQISAINNRNFLLVDRQGDFYHLQLKHDVYGEENLHSRKLAATFPINSREFLADTGAYPPTSLQNYRHLH